MDTWFWQGQKVHKNGKGFILSRKRFINLKKWYILSQLGCILSQFRYITSQINKHREINFKRRDKNFVRERLSPIALIYRKETMGTPAHFSSDFFAEIKIMMYGKGIIT
ncbi:hypothetical protein D1B31_16055 [Neobacillus notoginsengisoli]|uniref:Uncharacterized protein n=1 Tax=Neobacillus notoginsengisoli TaxID=1578198 RepID=A0A417YQZ5_9BACI|nr:hypothetical protein D1B31_16055 [Neobacillus notoginsengisoli]